MPSDDRDSKFERALAQHFRGGSAQGELSFAPDALGLQIRIVDTASTEIVSCANRVGHKQSVNTTRY